MLAWKGLTSFLRGYAAGAYDVTPAFFVSSSFSTGNEEKTPEFTGLGAVFAGFACIVLATAGAGLVWAMGAVFY